MARTNKQRGGRGVKIPIDAETLVGLAKIQCTYEEAAAVFDCDERTIKRRLLEPELRKAWDRGKALGRMSIRRLEFRHAQMSNSAGVQMTIHLAKHHLGETDKAALELTGRIDSNVQLTSARDRVNRKLDNLAERIARRVDGIAAAVGAIAPNAEVV